MHRRVRASEAGLPGPNVAQAAAQQTVLLKSPGPRGVQQTIPHADQQDGGSAAGGYTAASGEALPSQLPGQPASVQPTASARSAGQFAGPQTRAAVHAAETAALQADPLQQPVVAPNAAESATFQGNPLSQPGAAAGAQAAPPMAVAPNAVPKPQPGAATGAAAAAPPQERPLPRPAAAAPPQACPAQPVGQALKSAAAERGCSTVPASASQPAAQPAGQPPGGAATEAGRGGGLARPSQPFKAAGQPPEGAAAQAHGSTLPAVPGLGSLPASASPGAVAGLDFGAESACAAEDDYCDIDVDVVSLACALRRIAASPGGPRPVSECRGSEESLLTWGVQSAGGPPSGVP